jgi:hypothetical protein
MSYIGRLPLGEPDARLLRVLREQYPGERFDEHNISVDAPRSPELLRALNFLGVRVNRRRRSLSYRSHATLAEWLKRVEGWRANELRLVKDRIGWSNIEAVGLAPTGCTGTAG